MEFFTELEFCHYELNNNLNALLHIIQGETSLTIHGCGEVGHKRKQQAERYAQALEVWLNNSAPNPGMTNEIETVSLLLGKHDRKKDDLVLHLIHRLHDNNYEFYPLEEEDFETTESRIQHLENCCFNWKNNLLILLDEIGNGVRTYGWHGPGLFCSCGDVDIENNYPRMVKARLETIEAEDKTLLTQLRAKLEEVYPERTRK